MAGLKLKAHEHLHGEASSKLNSFPTKRFALILTWCTIGLTLPSLLWFAAIALASYVPSTLNRALLDLYHVLNVPG